MTYRNIRLHPFLRLIYLCLRGIAWVSIRVYYRARLVLGRAYFRFDGPAIVVSNHPSTLTDVLNVGIEIRQEMFFLANYGLFKHPVSNWILTRLFCIPIKRKEDVPEGAQRNNDVYFEQSYRHLEQNGVLFIAPEGYSWMNRFVRPLKTGTARIAFGTEARNNWQKDLKIIPVGLSYSQPNHFRSNLVVQAGAPVYLRDWRAAWEQDPEKAIIDLTLHLEQCLKTLSIHSRDEAGEQLLEQLETLLQNTHALPQQAQFERSQALAQHCLEDPELAISVNRYFDGLQEHAVSDEGVSAFIAPQAGMQLATDGLRLALGFPFFILGILFWFLPCFLPWLLAKRLRLYIGYDSNVKILAGLFTFPLAFWLLFRITTFQTGDWITGLLAVGFFVGLGLFCTRFWDILQRFRARQAAGKLAVRTPAIFAELVHQRAEILQYLSKKPAGLASYLT